MDKFVNQWKQKAQGGSGMVLSSSAGVSKKPGRQQRLEDLAKVHILQSSSNNPRLEEIMQIRTGIEQAMTLADAEQQLLKHLRHLACFELTHELIVDSQIGPLIRQLKESSSTEVARISGNIVEKLRKVVRRQARTLASQPPQRINKQGSSTTSNAGSSSRAQNSTSLQALLRPSTAAQPSSSAPATMFPSPCALQPGSTSTGSDLPGNTWGAVSMPAWGEAGASTNSYPAPTDTSQAGTAVGFGQGVLQQQGQLPPQHGYHQLPMMQQNGAWPAIQQQLQQYDQRVQPTGMSQHTQAPWVQQQQQQPQQQQNQPSRPWQQQLPAHPVQSSGLGTAAAPGADTGGGVAGRWMQRKKVPGRAIVIE